MPEQGFSKAFIKELPITPEDIIGYFIFRKEESMKKKTGMWINHRKAVIVTVGDDVERIRQIKSGIEKRVR